MACGTVTYMTRILSLRSTAALGASAHLILVRPNVTRVEPYSEQGDGIKATADGTHSEMTFKEIPAPVPKSGRRNPASGMRRSASQFEWRNAK